MKVDENAPLAPLTSMGVGGPAARLVTAQSTDEVVDTIREVDDADEALFVLSGGSNVVIADEGFAGTVLRIATSGIDLESADHCGGVLVRVAAGENWDAFVARAVAEGWSGVEALSGIPGLVGATPIQNVGAYGQEVAQTIASVRTWDRHEQRVRTFANAECEFSYRHSIFKGTAWRGQAGSSRYIVLEVVFQLELSELSQPVAYRDLAAQLGVAEGERAPLSQVREAVLAQRNLRGMVLNASDADTASCGSFFTNPLLSQSEWEVLARRAIEQVPAVSPPKFPAESGQVKTSAAWLIDHAGFGKGFGLPGPAALSTKHVLAITNRGGASAADIWQLAEQIQEGVHAAFGVHLVPEPVFLGQV